MKSFRIDKRRSTWKLGKATHILGRLERIRSRVYIITYGGTQVKGKLEGVIRKKWEVGNVRLGEHREIKVINNLCKYITPDGRKLQKRIKVYKIFRTERRIAVNDQDASSWLRRT